MCAKVISIGALFSSAAGFSPVIPHIYAGRAAVAIATDKHTGTTEGNIGWDSVSCK